jgi:hypothetical protein
MANINDEILTLMTIAIALSAYLSAIRIAGIQKISDLPKQNTKPRQLIEILLLKEIDNLTEDQINNLKNVMGTTDEFKKQLKELIVKLKITKTIEPEESISKNKRQEIKKKLRYLIWADFPMILSASLLAIHVLWCSLFNVCPPGCIVVIGLYAFFFGGAVMVFLHGIAWYNSLKGICTNDT